MCSVCNHKGVPTYQDWAPSNSILIHCSVTNAIEFFLSRVFLYLIMMAVVVEFLHLFFYSHAFTSHLQAIINLQAMSWSAYDEHSVNLCVTKSLVSNSVKKKKTLKFQVHVVTKLQIKTTHTCLNLL